MLSTIAKSINLAKQIRSDITKNWSEELFDYDLSNAFAPIYGMKDIGLSDKNSIICYIIFSYNPDSLWLDLKKDRIENKTHILLNIGVNVNDELYSGILANKNETVNISIFNFLEHIKDWRWRAVFDLIEYASKISRFASMETDDERKFQKTLKDGEKVDYTEEVEIKTIVSVNKDKGILIQQSIDAREKAHSIIEQIAKDFVQTDNATGQDFNFSFSETSKNKDPLSWREFIKERNQKKLLK
jgi:hypothetical protein